MMASYEGALAFAKGLGSGHARSHAACRSHEKRLHHATLNAVFLPHLLRENEGAAETKYERLHYAMGLQDGADLGDAIARLNSDLGIPENLQDMGLAASHGDGIVEYALKLDLSRLRSDPLSHLGSLSFKCQGAFPSES